MVVNSLSSVTGESLDVHMKFYDVMSWWRNKPTSEKFLKIIFCVVDGMMVNSLSSVTSESLGVRMKIYDIMSWWRTS